MRAQQAEGDGQTWRVQEVTAGGPAVHGEPHVEVFQVLRAPHVEKLQQGAWGRGKSPGTMYQEHGGERSLAHTSPEHGGNTAWRTRPGSMWKSSLMHTSQQQQGQILLAAALPTGKSLWGHGLSPTAPSLSLQLFK